jgi:hypothetical protein
MPANRSVFYGGVGPASMGEAFFPNNMGRE